MSDFRDEELGRTLLELEVPEHRSGFEDELVRRLTEVPRRRVPLLPAAVVALAVPVIAAIVLFAPRAGGPEVASAADLRAEVLDAAGSASTISGIFVNREQPSSGRENRWQFTAADSGSFRIAALDSRSVLAYDAAANVESSSDERLFVTRVGLAPGPPDAAAAGWVLQRGLGSVVAALTADDDDVREVDYAGRPAWQVRVPTGNPGEERLIVVDRETGIPVRSALFRNGTAGAEWRIEQLRVDEPAADESFGLTPSAGQTPSRYDMGFRRVALEDAADRVGYRPLVPTSVPDGFERAEVAVAERSRATGDEQRRNPESRDVVSLRYRRGLDQLVVTTRRAGSAPSTWGDPVIGSAPMGRAPERVTFSEGALEGESAEIVVDANSVPHVWVVAGALVVTVAGNLDRDELVRVAESLKPAG
jgi:hypothetical protein